MGNGTVRRWWTGGKAVGVAGATVAVALMGIVAPASAAPKAPQPAADSPIKHIVVIFQENHTFDNLLGKLCVEVQEGMINRGGADDSCDGVTTGTLSTGQTVTLQSAPDFVPAVNHGIAGQQTAIAKGKMDGFNLINGCTGSNYVNCYAQYDPLSGPCESANGSCITNVAALAEKYVISDHTFEFEATPSWAGHMVLASASMDGFQGYIPKEPSEDTPQPVSVGPGWGCDSGFNEPWGPNGILVPSCVPNSAGSLGPNWASYTGPKAPYIPTIFDELQTAGLTWKIYGGAGKPGSEVGFSGDGWAWAICPTFAECLYSSQRENLVPNTDILTDAADGTLPSYAIVTPTVLESQHNDTLMSEGDNWIGQVMTALMASPEWSSTAVLLTWDDCGCFYDHVNPRTYNSDWGIRLPMIIVSPWAKAGYTDTKPTNLAGILAFVEGTFHLPHLSTEDATAYDYSGSFCYHPSTDGCTNVGDSPLKMSTMGVPRLTPEQVKLSIAAGKEAT